MYNWSAGYSEIYPPRWNEQYKGQDTRYDRAKIVEIAKSFMNKRLDAAGGDWTKVTYDSGLLGKEFKDAGFALPRIDFNSEDTASRELKEETCLDTARFSTKKRFLISYDNTFGISQGDAPGQTGNRNHQYLDYLGALDTRPEFKGSDDVAIAEWINISDIQRRSPTEYTANGKPLSIYMLRGLESGIKMLWSHLLQEASRYESKLTGKCLTRFSAPENLATEIELFCARHAITIAEDSNLFLFMRRLAGDLPFQTYTGKTSQHILNCMLKVATYMKEPKLTPECFLENMDRILSPISLAAKLGDESPTFNLNGYRLKVLINPLLSKR